MTEKRCSVCGEIKPISAYQIRRASADGLTAACRACLAKRDAKRLEEPQRVAARLRVRRARRVDPAKQEKDNAGKREWNGRNPTKRAALVATSNAIRDGKLVRPDACERCNEPGRVLAHHIDFAKPLDVIWLCTACHGLLVRRVTTGADVTAPAPSQWGV